MTSPPDPTRRRLLGGSVLALAGLGLACSRPGAIWCTVNAPETAASVRVRRSSNPPPMRGA